MFDDSDFAPLPRAPRRPAADGPAVFILVAVLIALVMAALAGWTMSVRHAGQLAATVEAPLGFDDFGFPTPILPGGPRDQVGAFFNGQIAFQLDPHSLCPLWTMRIVQHAPEHPAERPAAFHPDPRVPRAWRVTDDDFRNNPKHQDRGHVSSNGDEQTAAGREASMRYTNIAAQNSDLNRGYWARRIEEGIRQTARDKQLGYAVVTIPLYGRARGHKFCVETMGGHDVWVSSDWSKAVCFFSGRKVLFMRAWLVPNEDQRLDLTEDACRITVAELQGHAHLDLFWKLRDELEEALEQQL